MTAARKSAKGETAIELRSGAAALGVALTERQFELLLCYLGLLQQWNRVFNLTAVRDPGAMRLLHLLDSLAVIEPLRRHAAGRAIRVLDVGSGAGLPGVVIAVCEPGWSVTTVDPVQKKVSFVRQVVGELELGNLQPIQARVEAMPESAVFDLVICRAFASLGKFIALTRHRLADRGVWVAMKGQWPELEATPLCDGVHVFHVEPLQIPELNAARCLVWACAN
jgi:16S rRNA (guanine527-N7)-methyltransferase